MTKPPRRKTRWPKIITLSPLEQLEVLSEALARRRHAALTGKKAEGQRRRSQPQAPVIFSPEDQDLNLLGWHVNRLGYATGSLTSWPIYAHALVCLRAFGRMANDANYEHTDHINRNRLDNRRENLRLVSAFENSQNISTTKYRVGVRFHKGKGKFEAYGRRLCDGTSRIGKLPYLGAYKTLEDAILAREKYEAENPLPTIRHWHKQSPAQGHLYALEQR